MHSEEAVARTREKTEFKDYYGAIARAEQNIDAGEYASAISILSELNRKNSNDTNVLSLLSEAQFLMKQYDDAKYYIDLARKIDSQSPDVQRNLSKVLLLENQTEDALELASNAVHNDKSNPKNFVALAAVHCIKKEFDKAENFLNIALDLDPNNAEAYYYKALISNQSNQYLSSIRILKKILNEKPFLDRCWYLLSRAYKETNSPKLALDAIDEALKFNANDKNYYIHKSDILIELNQKNGAIDQLTEYINKFGNDEEVYTMLGLAYDKLSQYEDSLYYHNLAIDLNPNYELAYRNKAQLLSNMNELEDAVECNNQLLNLNPNDASVVAEMGSLYSKMNQDENAESYFSSALRLDNSLPLPYVYKAYHLTLRDDLDSASQLLKKVRELPRKSPMAYVQLANIKAHYGKFSEALNLLNEGYRYFPGNPNIISNFSQLVSCAPPDYPLSKSHLGRMHLKLASLWKHYNTYVLPNDDSIKKFVTHIYNILSSYKFLNLPFRIAQIFRGEILDANCQKCKAVFNYHNIIPEVCFGCYKVVLSFDNLYDFLRFNFYMDRVDPQAHYRRKLMIDSRGPNDASLKGFYYFRDWDEAYRVSRHLKQTMPVMLKYDFGVKVKRGCSEFQDEYPDFNTMDSEGNFVMKCPDSWRQMEETFYEHRNHDGFAPKTKYEELGLQISDAFIIRNWVRMRQSNGYNDFQQEEGANASS